MKQLNLFIGLFLFFTITISAQKVTNVSNHQEQSTIIVSYDLETKSPCKIALFVSTNGGTTWQGPLKKLNGDVGAKVSSGNKSITWNVLEEFEELRGTNIMFQVRSEDLNIETIQIGNQVWTKKNLEISTYRNGDIIPEVKDPKEWATLTTGAWCYYNNDPKNGQIYGKLYNGYAINDPRGLAPEGYHIPTEDEWYKLINFLGGRNIAAGKLKSTRPLWLSPNIGATNESRFTALPGGHRLVYCEIKENSESLNSSYEEIKLEGWWAVAGYNKYYRDKKTYSSYSFPGPGHLVPNINTTYYTLKYDYTHFTDGSKYLGTMSGNNGSGAGGECNEFFALNNGASVRCVKD